MAAMRGGCELKTDGTTSPSRAWVYGKSLSVHVLGFTLLWQGLRGDALLAARQVVLRHGVGGLSQLSAWGSTCQGYENTCRSAKQCWVGKQMFQSAREQVKLQHRPGLGLTKT